MPLSMQKVARNEKSEKLVESPTYPSGQDKPILLRFFRVGTERKICLSFCHIINPLLLIKSRWLKSSLVMCAFLLSSTSSQSINTQKRTWPIYNHLERTSLVNNAYVKEIHDDAHLRLKRASPSIARGRFNFSGENADRQN